MSNQEGQVSGPVPGPSITDAVGKSNSSLTDHLDDLSLMRGVPSRHVLRDLGAVFKGSTGTSHDYNLSKETMQLDDFISHDWESGRWKKTFSLLLRYNSRAACVASMVTAAVLGIIQLDSVALLPKPQPVLLTINGKIFMFSLGMWCTIISPLVFMVFFVYWQDVRSCLGLHTPLMFVDKLCVDQEDETRKLAGVRGLAGFLRNSKHLVVCWTDQYFTRLWCVYEIASWLHLEKSMHTVKFIAAAQAKQVMVVFLFDMMFFMGFVPLQIIFSGRPTLVMAICITLGMCWVEPEMLTLMRGLTSLPKQLAEFSIMNTECFCCKHAHVMPDTQQPLTCDRKVIYKTIAKWFKNRKQQHHDIERDKDEERQEALDLFDDFVRQEFAPLVLTNAGPNRMKYSDCLVMSCPAIWAAGDVLASLGSVPCLACVQYILDWFALALLLIPTAFKLIIHFFAFLDSITGSPTRPYLDCSLYPIRVLSMTLIIFVLWLPRPTLYSHTLGITADVVYVSILALLTASMFRSHRD